MKSDSDLDSVEIPWILIESYFKPHHLERLSRHQIESYNYFVNTQIHRTVEMFNPIRVASEHDFDAVSKKHSLVLNISFSNLTLLRPQIQENNGATKLMFPHEARIRNFTYASTMTLDMKIEYLVRSGENLQHEDIFVKTIPKIQIGKLPIMLNSSICVLQQYSHVDARTKGECPYDAGGYFIINGSEKTVLGQERSTENKIFIFQISKTNNKYSMQAEIKSVPRGKSVSPKQICMMISTKNNGFGFPIVVQLQRIRQPVPLFYIFRALGVETDKEIVEKILLTSTLEEWMIPILQSLQSSIIDANERLTKEKALKYISSFVVYSSSHSEAEKMDYTMEVLKSDLFPHCNNVQEQIYFLGYMTNKLLRTSLDLLPLDDRDSYINKRVDTTGVLLNNLFRNYFNKLLKDMEKQLIKEINNGYWKSTADYESIVSTANIYKLIKSTTIENGIKRALSTGDFGVKQMNSTKVGVAQVLNRLTYVSSLSHSRRISTPTDKSGKLISPRKLHGTSWGFICPVETPEGQSVGIVKNLSYMAHITIASSFETLYECILPEIQILDRMAAPSLYHSTKVFINGSWVGTTETPLELFQSLKQKKLCGIINIFTSVVFDYRLNEIRVSNDAGRFIRPLLRVQDKKTFLTKEIIEDLEKGKLKWDDLLLSGQTLEEAIVEYVDAEEQSWSLVGMNMFDLKSSFTHCEIHPSTIFGILGSCIPFPEHNQAPRNTYQCAQAKQAMGVYVTNFDKRLDKTSYVLCNPTKPLVDTRIMDMIQINNIPSGCNVIVAIMSYTGYNQEDSLLFNKASLDRGLFQAIVFNTEKDEDKQKVNGGEEVRCKPDKSKTSGIKFANYEKLDPRGMIAENTFVENRDVIIGKVIPIKENRNDHTKVIKFQDESRMYRTNEETFCDKVEQNKNGDGYNFVKVRLRSLRKPVIGDKFSSRSGQKGTIGNIIPEDDMPYTRNGLKPDLILNPHAIPSRMTIAQLKETLLGKVLLHLGLFGDGTSFGNLDIDVIRRELVKLGYESNGNEIMYDGLTGQMMECSIFIGPVFYQRLKHMVIDKQHSRSIGPMVNLTRQPAEGRSRDGGLRFGEMERDCMISHGASAFTKGRLYDASDKFAVYVCNNTEKPCGMIAAFNDKLNIHICRSCGNRTSFSYVQLPYACKLLFHELESINVVPRILTDSDII
jgi:DNA-directed RNA polymerase II subunit RPB2